MLRNPAAPLLAFVVSASIAQAQITPPSSQCQAAYGLLGPGIAKSQIAIVHAGGNVEIATSMGSYNPVPGTFWFTLRFDPAAGTYVQTFVSSIFASHQIVRTLAADVLGNSDEEVIVGLDSGQILVADGATHATLSSFTLPAGTLTALTTADLDGNGKAELLAVVNNRLYAYSAAGTQLWSVTGPSGIDVVAAQMDGDTGLEVATASGHVVDVRTRSIQWFVPAGFGIRLAANDFDGDGRAELIAARDNSAVLAFDVDTQSQKWSIPWSDLDQIAITDLDGNGAAELLIGDGQWGAIHVYDPATQQQIDQFSNSLAGVTAIAAGDVDGDGANELLFAGGWSSSGENHLYVVNRTSHAVEYTTPDLEGPFVGAELGDVDGDGVPEIVACTFASNAGYSSGRILVLDPATLRLRSMSPPIMANLSFEGTHALQLANIDADPQLEIVVAADQVYNGRIEIYDFTSPGVFTLVWSNATQPPGCPFMSVAVGDVDGDGNLEVVGGVDEATSMAQGPFVYVYDLATHNEEWHSASLGAYPISRIEIGDTDLDGRNEIVALSRGNGDLYFFDGVTRALDGLVPGNLTSLSRLDTGWAPGQPCPILTGDATGHVSVFRFVGTGYQAGALAPLATSTIQNAQSNSTSVFVQAGGTIRQHHRFDTVPLWQSVNYGTVGGCNVVYTPNAPLKVTVATNYGIFGF